MFHDDEVWTSAATTMLNRLESPVDRVQFCVHLVASRCGRSLSAESWAAVSPDIDIVERRTVRQPHEKQTPFCVIITLLRICSYYVSIFVQLLTAAAVEGSDSAFFISDICSVFGDGITLAA
jgi:hypothetical protein